MLFEAFRAARDIGRMQDIAAVLVRFGFDDLVHRLGLGRLIHRTRALFHKGVSADLRERDTSERVRRALEELGPTFVKLGQMLAGRQDLLPPDWIEEFSRLHEDVQPVPWDVVRAELVQSLGAEPEEVFAEVESEPLAAGSIAQVHRARLHDGTRVVLKVRRPGIRQKVEADLRLLARLAEVAETEFHELARYRPRMLVRQLSRSLRDELDLRIEAKNTQLIGGNCAELEGVVVARIHDQWTREALLVQSELLGTSAAEWARTGEPADLDRKGIAAAGARAILEMVFVHGHFHADPHPGNFLFLDGENIGLLDFGMVGRLSEGRRRELVRILLAIVTRDDRALVDLLLEWAGDSDVDVEAFQQDCRSFIDRYEGVPLRDLDAGAVLMDLTDLIRENDLFLPADVAMLVKVFVTLEGFGRLLDPDFDMSACVEPFAERLVKSYGSPLELFRRNARDTAALLSSLPRDLLQLASRIRRGRYRFELDLRRLDHFGRQLDRSANRITMGLVTSALIVGGAIAMTVDGGWTIFGLPLFGFLGFATSTLMGVVLLWSVFRSSRS